MRNPETNNNDFDSDGLNSQITNAPGAVKALLFLAGPWLIFAVLCAISAGRQFVDCLIFGLVMTAAGLLAWKFLGPQRIVLYLLSFLVCLSLFRIWYLVAVPNELSGDEALYWQSSRHLDWCYTTKGPGIAFCIWCTRAALGDTELGVRASAVIFSFGSSLVLYLLGTRLYNPKVGVFSAILLQLTPIFAFFGMAMTTDPPFVFMWLLSLLFMHWAWKSASPLSWILLGPAIGAGILCKDTMSTFFLPALLILVLTPARRQLLTPWPYLSILLCLVVLWPMILWNWDHGWMSFFHNIGQIKTSRGFHLTLSNFLMFSGSQLGAVTPLLLAMMVWALIKLRGRDPFSFWFSIPLLALFLLKSLMGKVQANWALNCYLTGFIVFSACFLAGFSSLSLHVERLTIAAVAFAVFCTISMHAVCLIPFPPKLDPLKKIRCGSAQLGHEVSLLAEQLKPQRFIFTHRYATASLLSFYIDGQPTTYCVNFGRRINNYDLWPDFHDLIGYDAVFVIPGDRKMPVPLADKFQEYQKHLVKARSPIGGTETIYSVFLCRNFKGMERVTSVRYN